MTIAEVKKLTGKEKKALKASKTKILNESRAKQKELLEEKEEELEQMIKSLRRKAKHEGAATQAEELDKIRRRLRAGIKDLAADDEDDKLMNVALPGEAPKEVKEGEQYFVPHLNFLGTVTAAPSGRNKRVRISSGTMTYTVDINQLRMPSAEQMKGDSPKPSNGKTRRDRPVDYKADSATRMRLDKARTVMPELMLIGKTVAEAESALDSYIDDCQLAGIHDIRIVHGKGTGALRKGIHEYLKRQSYVKSFRLGEFGEGDAGVTIVEL